MTTLDDVAEFARSLPEVTEGARYGMPTWFVDGNGFVWIRPFSKADIKRFGDETAPAGPIIAARVEDLEEKEAVLAAGTSGLFSIPHFDGHPAVLIDLATASDQTVRRAIVDGWLACAPNALADEHADRLVGEH